MDNRHRLLFLDPGHFHAALTLRGWNPRLADDIVVYAPDGAERRDFLTLVDRMSHTRAQPWTVHVVTTNEPLDALIAERRGDVVVLAGRNGGKARTMRRLHDAGFHVLADKPWLVRAADLEDVRASLAGPPVAAEIMTGRHDGGVQLFKRLIEDPAVFGGFRDEAPALELASVHHLLKLVDGVPLRRPWWYFDVRVQGSGIVDIPTHLVDRAQWLTGVDPAALLTARMWPTRVSVEEFRVITGEPGFPSALGTWVHGNTLEYLCNAELQFSLGGVTVAARSAWTVTAPSGGGDTSMLIARGTRADLRLEQGAATGYHKQLSVAPHGAPAYQVPIPSDGGHEAHFAQVLENFLRAIDHVGRDTLGGMGGHSGPSHLQRTTLAKYTLLAEAVGATLRE